MPSVSSPSVQQQNVNAQQQNSNVSGSGTASSSSFIDSFVNSMKGFFSSAVPKAKNPAELSKIAQQSQQASRLNEGKVRVYLMEKFGNDIFSVKQHRKEEGKYFIEPHKSIYGSQDKVTGIKDKLVQAGMSTAKVEKITKKFHTYEESPWGRHYQGVTKTHNIDAYAIVVEHSDFVKLGVLK